MAKDKGPGCLMYLFGLFLLGCLAVYFIFSNGFNFKTLLVYGPSQYAANIWHFHDDYYCQAKSTLKIYGDILPVDSIGKSSGIKPIITLKPGQRFKLKGYRNKEYVQWVAVKVANGPDVIYGYFMIPEKVEIPTFMGALNRFQRSFGDSSSEPFTNKYFREIPQKSTEGYRNGLLRDLKTKLGQAVQLKKTTDPSKMQKIKESKDFKIIEDISSDTTVYYCPKNEYEKAEAMYEAYLGNGFDTHYVQIARGYNPARDGVSKESLIVRVADSWYFKGFIALLLLWLYRRIRRGPRSKSSRGNPVSNNETYEQEIQTEHNAMLMNLSPEMSVGMLKRQFTKAFGCEIRVYTTVKTKRLADDDISLSSLRDVSGSLGSVPVDRSVTVSEIERQFKALGIGIQVMKPGGRGIAPNDVRLNEL